MVICGGFTCSKNALVALNILYMLVAVLLISVAAYGKAVAIITSLAIMGGVITCGVILLFIAVIGLIGAVKHHQVMLFFYMIVLFLLFLIQFAIACACIAMTQPQQKGLAKKGWQSATDGLKKHTQYYFDCCGFENPEEHKTADTSCKMLACCKNSQASCCQLEVSANTTGTCRCPPCWTVISSKMDQALKIAGGIGLFFSFTEMIGLWLTVRYRNQKDPKIIGVWLALRYRNQKDPRANPSAFL